jgi:hypothetical protein
MCTPHLNATLSKKQRIHATNVIQKLKAWVAVIGGIELPPKL